MEIYELANRIHNLASQNKKTIREIKILLLELQRINEENSDEWLERPYRNPLKLDCENWNEEILSFTDKDDSNYSGVSPEEGK